MSIESESRKALRRAVFYRFLQNCLEFPRRIFLAFADTLDSISDTIFYLELDAANRYRLLTGSDLGVASGEETRYIGMTKEAFEQAVLDNAELDDDDDDD